MIIDLDPTTTSAIAKKLLAVREEAGVFALTRVLTLIVSCSTDDAEEAIEAANLASNEHPMRIIVVVHDAHAQEDRLTAQVRVGSDAGASEVIVLTAYGEVASDDESLVTGLLLPDAPVVVWWPGDAPDTVGDSPLGRLAQRRITDAIAAPDSLAALDRVRRTYTPGDTDLAWTRLTGWRTQIASLLAEVHTTDVTSVTLRGVLHTAPVELLATWLSRGLGGIAVTVSDAPSDVTSWSIHSVTVETTGGTYALTRESESVLLRLERPHTPEQFVPVPRKNLSDCIAEELRRLDSDDAFGDVLAVCDSSHPHPSTPQTPTGGH